MSSPGLLFHHRRLIVAFLWGITLGIAIPWFVGDWRWWALAIGGMVIYDAGEWNRG
jgi:hypothetical protein